MAIHINRVYTRGGDLGQTSLVGGARVPKDCLKLDSYGTIDELLCLVGTARTLLDAKGNGLSAIISKALEGSLRRIQNRLFDVGSILATPAGQGYPGMPELSDADSLELEQEMDRMQDSLKPLTSFVLPGGTMANALLHQCRAVCRRAEREIVSLSREEEVDAKLLKYINRLSDLFFVMSRYVSKKAGAPEYLWEFGAAASGKAKAKTKAKVNAKIKTNPKKAPKTKANSKSNPKKRKSI